MAIQAGDIVYQILGDDKSLRKTMAGVGKVAAIGGAAITGALGMAVKSAADFQQAITNAAVKTGNLGGELDATKKRMAALAKELGGSTAFSASQAAEAFGILAAKGIDASTKSAEELKPILDLAAATNVDLASSASLVTGAMASFGKSFADTGHLADVFTLASNSTNLSTEKLLTIMPIAGTAANQLGVSIEELTAAAGKLTDQEIDASTAGTALRNIMLDMQNGAPDLDSALESVGLTVADLDIQSNGLAGAFQIMKDAGLDSTDMLAAFGKRNGVAGAAVLENLDAIKQLTGELQGNVGASANAAEEQLKTLSGQLTLLSSAFEAIVIPIGEALIPALTAVSQKVGPILQGMSEWMKINPELSQTIVIAVGAVGALMLALGPLLILLPGLVTAFTVLTGPIGLVIAGVTALGGLAIWLVSRWDAIRASWAAVWNLIKDTVTGVTDFIASLLPDWAIDMLVPFQGLYDGIVGIFGPLKDWFSNLFSSIFAEADQQARATRATMMGALSGLPGFSALNMISGGGLMGFAKGGRVKEDGVYTVGEFGPELVRFPTGLERVLGIMGEGRAFLPAKAYVYTAAQTRRMFGGDVEAMLSHGHDMTVAAAMSGGNGFAAGGVSPGGMFTVGEYGPEDVYLPQGSRVMSAGDTKKGLMGSSNTVNVNLGGVVIRNDMDANTLARKVGQQVQRQLFGRGYA